VLDLVVLAFYERLLGVDGNFGGGVGLEAWEVCDPFVIRWETLLWDLFRVGVGVHCGDGIVPRFLY